MLYEVITMFGESVITLQKLYMTAYQADDIDNYLDIVFKEQLGKLYEARKSERLNLRITSYNVCYTKLLRSV